MWTHTHARQPTRSRSVGAHGTKTGTAGSSSTQGPEVRTAYRLLFLLLLALLLLLLVQFLLLLLTLLLLELLLLMVLLLLPLQCLLHLCFMLPLLLFCL